MSTAINNYSLSNTPLIGSAGSDPRKKFAFDDLLLLPSVPSTSGLNRNYLCYSAKVSPVLPPIAQEVDVQRKYKTAPASPNHHDYDYLSSVVTPQTSPVFGRAKLAATSTQLPDCCPVNQQENLPSLRHLQLLPDPRIQEYACYYPDTSEHTPIWKRTLVHWCKEKNYQDYTKIVHEISHDRTQLTALLKGSATAGGIPSVLKPKDAFHGLSDHAKDRSTPMTPPMSPLDEMASDQPPEFTPFVSSKLIQTVRQNNRNLSSSKNRHKKTNSFKALQLKKMLNNRDILANDSQTNATKYKISKKASASASSSASASPPSLGDSPGLRKLEISSAARNLVMLLDAQTKRSSSPSRPSEPIASSSTTPTLVSKAADRRPRSRSLSPVRPATPPNTAASSGYHRFAYDSPQSPVATLRQGHAGSTKTTPKRRRSSGSSSALRKCVSCHSNDSPCWRPSWSGRKQDQLCNSCGLRYKKTHTRCLNDACRKIPTKSELSIMKSNGLLQEYNPDGTITIGYKCLFCNSIAETSDADSHSHA
ncbi:hypothetical protein HG536_0E02040 [Torulaspora globosa]|uniref:GATA-type domain-containing protein n=1 Tax=Torulaspora globosa TaxID=48254 RepID=A0A7G3ZIF7_9SACH|nr:uncharacterized protein HG536_0E02040 [Torulaspora globosa]QLL33293.1 hypothetical protein HG536_0E02040 [Torulaspora globosa]